MKKEGFVLSMKTVLVVDDQPGIRLLLQEVLTNEGYEVVTAQNGKEAVERTEKEEIDLLILDYKLPILNGEEVIKKMKNKKEQIPIILVTGLGKIGLDLAGYPFVKKVVEKPFNIQGICDDVRALLR
jgi:DNA-binding response OmpR family regulator